MAQNEIRCEVTGSVWKVMVSRGSVVSEGDLLMICESMKMEIPVQAELGGTVVEVRVAEGDAVADGDVVAVIES